MIIWLKEILMQILIWLLGFIDTIFNVFRSVAGLDTVTTTAGEQTISAYFLHLNGVQWAFWCIFIASIGICVVCTVVAVVKNIINAKGGEPKSHVRTLGQSLSTTVIALFMAMLLVVGIGCAERLLGAVDKSINHGEQSIMSHEIVNISAGDGYVYDIDNIQGLNKFDENGNCTYTSYLYRFKCTYFNGGIVPLRDSSLRIVFIDDNDNPIPNVYTDNTIDESGNSLWKIPDENLKLLSPIRTRGGWRPKDLYAVMTGDDSAYYSKNDLRDNFWDESVVHILGDDSWTLVPVPHSWKRDGLVEPDSFNFIIAYICAIVLLIALIGATFGLVKRLYDIVLLFIALPGITATIPLDDGAKFKLWRETVISKVFLAFGTVLAVNVFTIVAPSIWGISVGTASGGFTNSVLRLVLICGGALSISGGQLLFARLLGTSAEESREMAQSARTLMGGAMTGLGMAKAAGRGLFGYRNANGQRVGGLIKGGASVAGTVGVGAVNALGGALGGQAYTNSKFGKGVSAVQTALKGFGGSSGWFGKDKSDPTGNSNTLGGSIASGLGGLGGKFANSKAGQKSGLNNGIVGAVRKPIDDHRAAGRQNARNMLAQSSEALSNAYGVAAAAESAKQKALPHDDFGREVMAGFEGGAPSTLPAPVTPAQSAAQKAAGKKE